MTRPADPPDPCVPFGWPPAEWERRARELGQPLFRARQIFDALHRRAVVSFAQMTELSRADRLAWEEAVRLALPEVARRENSADGSVKYGLKFADGSLVETVFMPRGEGHASAAAEFADVRVPASAGIRPVGTLAGPAPDERATVCLSSQTGCSVDCQFCVTGRLGAGRNLSAGEIVAQLLVVQRLHPGVHYSLVFMGMGEPMLNYDNVDRALDIFFETISPRRVTVSTSGFPDGIRRLAKRRRQPGLAVSINAADEQTREKIMPVTRKYPLAEVISAMKEFPLPHRRRITAEYVLLAGVNDSVGDAEKLGRLLSGIPVKINVIPFNPDPRYTPEFRRPEERAINQFVDALAKKNYTVTVRRSKGRDTLAACGQLKGREIGSRPVTAGRKS